MSLWLILTAMLPARAQSVGLAAEMPFGGFYRVGSWVPVSCGLVNQGPPADVQLTAQLRGYGPNPLLQTYELGVALPSPANRRYSLYVMPSWMYGSRALALQLQQERRVVARQELTLRALNDADRLAAVITAQEGGFGGLAGSRLPPPGGRRPNYGGPSGYPGVSSNPGQVQVAYVKPELAPDRAVGYDTADLVILSGVPAGALSPPQERALTRWVQAGGTLVATGGAEPGALQSPTLRALLPVELTGTVTLSGVQAFRHSGVQAFRAGTRAAGDGAGLDFPERHHPLRGYPARTHHPLRGYPPASRVPGLNAPFVATACRPKPGAETMEARPGVPILAQWSVGAGRVVFLAADPALPPLRGWDGLTALWRSYLLHPPPGTRFLGTFDAADRSGGVPVYTGGPRPEPPFLASACQQVSQMGVPGFAFVGLFLLSYIVALVPVNYLVLKRRDRRELAWVTTPAIVLGFSGLAYLVGYGTKGGQVVLAQAGVVEAWATSANSQALPNTQHPTPDTQHLSAAPVLACFGLFSPSKSRYDLAAEDGAVPLMPAESGSESDRRLRVVEGDAFGLKDVPINMWDMGLFEGRGVVELGGGFHCDLKRIGGQVVGRVMNQTRFDLEGAALLTGSARPVFWGTFRRGETRAVAAAWSPGGAGSLLPPAVLQTVPGQDVSSRMRRTLLEPLTTWSPTAYGYGGQAWPPLDHPVLLGWVREPLLPTRVDGHRVRDEAAYLFLVHLPLR